MISDTQNGVDASADIASAPATREDTQQSRTWRCSISEATGAQQAIINKFGKDKDVTKRFATNVSCGSTTAMWFQAFFVFVKPKRRGWLQRNIVAEAEWMPAVYSEDWPEAARTSKHSVDFSHQGRASPTTGAAIGDAPSMPPQSAVRRAQSPAHSKRGCGGSAPLSTHTHAHARIHTCAFSVLQGEAMSTDETVPPASEAWRYWRSMADVMALLVPQQPLPGVESAHDQAVRLQLPALDPRAAHAGISASERDHVQAKLTEFLHALYCVVEGVDAHLGCDLVPDRCLLRPCMEYLGGASHQRRVYRHGSTWRRVFEREYSGPWPTSLLGGASMGHGKHGASRSARCCN